MITSDLGLDAQTSTGNRQGRNQRELLRYAASKKMIQPMKKRKWEWDSSDTAELDRVRALLSMKGRTSWGGVAPPQNWRNNKAASEEQSD